MTVEVIAAIGLAVLAILVGVVLWIVGEVAAKATKGAVFRRPSFAERRQRHRGLMKTGYLCGVLAFTSGFIWLVVATNDFKDDAADARVFLVLAAALALGAVVFLTAWWRRAGRPRHYWPTFAGKPWSGSQARMSTRVDPTAARGSQTRANELPTPNGLTTEGSP